MIQARGIPMMAMSTVPQKPSQPSTYMTAHGIIHYISVSA